MPLADAAYAAISIIPVPNLSFSGSTRLPVCFLAVMSAMAYTMPKAIGNIIAVAAVLLVHIERKAQMNPKANRIQPEFPREFTLSLQRSVGSNSLLFRYPKNPVRVG